MYLNPIYVARTAVSLSHDSEHWESALQKALDRLPTTHWRLCAGKLFVVSAQGGGWYVVRADGSCSCTAGSFGRLCWHRALFELLHSVDGR